MNQMKLFNIFIRSRKIGKTAAFIADTKEAIEKGKHICLISSTCDSTEWYKKLVYEGLTANQQKNKCSLLLVIGNQTILRIVSNV